MNNCEEIEIILTIEKNVVFIIYEKYVMFQYFLRGVLPCILLNYNCLIESGYFFTSVAIVNYLLG